MFEAIRNNKRISQVILGILIVPFAVFGLNSYFGDGPGGGDIATVGGAPISRGDFERALEREQGRLRAELGEGASPAMLESDKLRQAVLDELMIRRALELYFREMRLSVSVEQLQQALAEDRNFQENGQFSRTLYREVLAQQRLTPEVFEAQLAQNLLIQQLAYSISDSSLVARDSARHVLAAELETRDVREMRFPVKPASIEIDEADVRKYYDGNLKRFELPERVKAEYVVFSEDALLGRIEVSEADIQKAYQDLPREPYVRHILIGLAPDADAAAVEAARKEAEGIAATLRREPGRFPALAREKSQDPGSSEAGGNLGYIARGVTVPPFEEAAFALKQDAISDPVRTEFGFHILQVTAQKRPLAEVHGAIAARLRRQGLGRGFNERAEEFSNKVFGELSGSLQPVAEEFGLEIRQTGWIDRGTDALGEFRNEYLVASLFDEGVLSKRNLTQAVDVGSDTLVAARVLEHEAVRRVPFEEVRGSIEAQLRREKAMRVAREEGNAVLEALDRGDPVDNAWSESRSFQRSSANLPPLAARAVFAAPWAGKPMRVAAELPDDAYVIYQIDKAERPPIDESDPRITAVSGQYRSMLARSDFESFVAFLRERYKVVVKPVMRQATEEDQQ
jgi:peptidyl-prolyl cis-trans isomerase D